MRGKDSYGVDFQDLQSHLANDCDGCPENIQNYWLEFNLKNSLDDDIITTNKKRKIKSQTGINDYFESRELPENKKSAIDKALVRAFVCCGISFSIVDNPFFREFLYQLRPNYNPPNRKTLSGSLMNQETVRINKAVKKKLENSENLTLGILNFNS